MGNWDARIQTMNPCPAVKFGLYSRTCILSLKDTPPSKWIYLLESGAADGYGTQTCEPAWPAKRRSRCIYELSGGREGPQAAGRPHKAKVLAHQWPPLWQEGGAGPTRIDRGRAWHERQPETVQGGGTGQPATPG